MTTSAQTTFEAMDVAKLRPHPKNIRHEVTISDELLDSIRSVGILQPLVVAPHPTLDGDYTVIAGHHRLTAARKLGLGSVPVIVRMDLHSAEKQVAAMVAENLHRKDLTITEEIDAVQTMLSFDGWNANRVAKETGQSLATVRQRQKLGGLDDESRSALTAGQLTLTQAAEIAEFEDRPEVQADLVAVANDKIKFDWQLQRIREQDAWENGREALRTELFASGVQVAGGEVSEEDFPVLRFNEVTGTVKDFTQAAERGAIALLDDVQKKVRYFVPRPFEEAETGEPDPVGDDGRPPRPASPANTSAKPRNTEASEAEAQSAQAQWDELRPSLATLQRVEADWIIETVSGLAGPSAERSKLWKTITEHFQPWVEGSKYYGFNSGLAWFREDYASEPDKVPDLGSVSFREQVALAVITSYRVPISLPSFWQGIAQKKVNAYQEWFQLREQMGWKLQDIEEQAREIGEQLLKEQADDDF